MLYIVGMPWDHEDSPRYLEAGPYVDVITAFTERDKLGDKHKVWSVELGTPEGYTLEEDPRE